MNAKPDPSYPTIPTHRGVSIAEHVARYSDKRHFDFETGSGGYNSYPAFCETMEPRRAREPGLCLPVEWRVPEKTSEAVRVFVKESQSADVWGVAVRPEEYWKQFNFPKATEEQDKKPKVMPSPRKSFVQKLVSRLFRIP